MGVYTARWDAENKCAVPSNNGKILVFPYVQRGAVVAEHYRTPDKRFSQRPGGKKVFFNGDVLDDPALREGRASLIITEGEPDCCVAVDCGFPHAVSVPDGAPPPRSENASTEISVEAEATGKFSYLWNERDRLRDVKRIIVAVDNDEPGKRLEEELVRRLGAWRCLYVTYPTGCKDLNDVRNAFGPEMVAETLNNARPFPVKGLYRMSDYRDPGPLQTYPTGLGGLIDDYFKPYPGEFIVITGTPSDGKSTWTMNLLYGLYRCNGWRSAVFSPEMPAVPFLRDKLRRIVNGMSNSRGNPDPVIDDAFVFIDNDWTSDASDEDVSIDWILERATDAVMRDGIRVLLIDPFNEVEHARLRGESLPEYISRQLRNVKRWGQRYGVVTIIIAHPTKDVQEKGKRRTPTLYDVDGAAHWFNKCDVGIVIERPDPTRDEAAIHVAKVRQDETGQRGTVMMSFDRRTSTYGALDGSNYQEGML